MKRFLAILLCLCLLMCGALAESTESEEYELSTDEEIVVDSLVNVDDLQSNGVLDAKGWWNILLIGGDSRTDGKYGRTDTMIVLSVNPVTNQIKLTSFMRDMWVPIYNSGSNKLNAANVYGGPELLMRTLNECFDLNLTQYVLIDMRAFWDVVDIIGGITVPINEREMYFINEQQYYNCTELNLSTDSYKKLTETGDSVVLDGCQALAYVRIRHIDSDFNRTSRQRTALVAMASKVQNEATIGTVISIATTILSYVETNIGLPEILQLCTIGMNMDAADIEQYRVPADGTFITETINERSVISADFEKNTALLYEFIYEETAAD